MGERGSTPTATASRDGRSSVRASDPDCGQTPGLITERQALRFNAREVR
jgi:hypothetical protein